MITVIIQLIFNSLVLGLQLALIAVGFNIIFNITKVFHLAHGAVLVGAGYTFIWLLNFWDYSSSVFPSVIWICCIIMALLVTIFVSWLMEWLVYRPLDKKKSGQAISLVSSMAIFLLIVNLIALIFGNETKVFHQNLDNRIFFYDIVISHIQLAQLLVSILVLTSLIFFSSSKKFLPFRAIMSKQIVASVMGVNASAVRLLAMAIGSVLAAIVAILKLYDTGIDPYSGMDITLSAAVTVIIGGNGSLHGTVIAALLLTFLQTLTEWFLSAEWKQGVTFLLLILVIMWKTEGLVSFKMRVEEA